MFLLYQTSYPVLALLKLLGVFEPMIANVLVSFGKAKNVGHKSPTMGKDGNGGPARPGAGPRIQGPPGPVRC